MYDADRLQMFANAQRAILRRLLEAIVPLRSRQHLLWEKGEQERLRNLLESVESLQRESEWADVRTCVWRRLADREVSPNNPVLLTCTALTKDAEALMSRSHELLDQIEKGDWRPLAALRAVLERHHVAAIGAMDHDVGPLLTLARAHLRTEDWFALVGIAHGGHTEHLAAAGQAAHAVSVTH